eukprot:gene51876-63433_t
MEDRNSHHHLHRPIKRAKQEWVEKSAAAVPQTVQQALREAMRIEKVSPVEFDDLLWILAQESGGVIGVRNKKSTARGLFQLLSAQYGLNPQGERSFENDVARYGQDFKNKALAKLLPPESAPLDQVAAEVGVSASTLERWRSDALSQPRSNSKVWSAAARFDALLTTAAMDEAAKSAWC